MKNELQSYHHINTNEEQSTFDDQSNSIERSTELVTIQNINTKYNNNDNDNNDDFNIRDDIADDKLLFGGDTFEEIPLEKDVPISNEPLPIIPNRKGYMCMLFFNKNGSPLICIGPHWPFTLCLFTFISVISTFYFYGLWNILNCYVRNVGLCIVFIQLGSYITTFLMNPGLPPKQDWLENNAIEISPNVNYTICKKCRVIRREEDKTKHCDECDVCVIGYDHHCPWTSKCIGKRNLILFYIFVTFTFVLLFYFFFGIFTLAATFSQQTNRSGKKLI